MELLAIGVLVLMLVTVGTFIRKARPTPKHPDRSRYFAELLISHPQGYWDRQMKIAMTADAIYLAFSIGLIFLMFAVVNSAGGGEAGLSIFALVYVLSVVGALVLSVFQYGVLPWLRAGEGGHSCGSVLMALMFPNVIYWLLVRMENCSANRIYRAASVDPSVLRWVGELTRHDDGNGSS